MKLRPSANLVRPTLIVAAVVSVALLSACGGSSSATVTPSPTIVPTASQAATPAGSPAASGQVTLKIDSITPNPAAADATVTVTYTTQADNVIGLQVVDGGGNITTQEQLTAGSDGKAVYSFTAHGQAGTWTISAAAGRTLGDLLALQAHPAAGPNTADGTFVVQ